MAPMQTKPFPWKCGHCGQRTVVPRVHPYALAMEHDGRKYAVSIPDLESPTCTECGEMVRDDAANERITAALRQAVGLLTPEQIRQNREALGLTQREFAKQLGIAEATVSRWETGGQIQQRSLDRLMRLFFSFPEVRDSLGSEAGLREMGRQALARANGERSESNQEMQAVKAAIQKALTSCQDALRLADAG